MRLYERQSMRFDLSKKIKIRLIRVSLFLALLFWLIGFSTPCIDSTLLKSFYPFQKQFYSLVCHQKAEKSFECNNSQLLVCARCSGIYFGASFSSLIIIFFNRYFSLQTKWLILFSLPMLLDVILLTLNIYEYNKLLSAFTGFLFGSNVFLYILSAIENLLLQKNNL